MKYDITKPTVPMIPNLGGGTECVKLLLSQVSKGMKKTISRCFSSTWRKISGVKFQYPDLFWKELCGQMANLVAESGGNKG